MMTKPAVEMNRSTVHALSPVQNCRDRGRQSFIFHTKRHLGQFARSTLQAQFEDASLGCRGVIADDKAALLETHPVFAAWSALNIGSQQQMWRALEDMVVRQAPHMDAVANGLADGASRLGSLQTDPNLTMPAYFADTAYHGQPGGYCLDRGANDWHAGAQAGYRTDRWEVTVWGKNLTDDDTAMDILRYIDTQAFVSQPGPPCSVVSPAFNPAANCGGFFAWSGTNIGGGSVIPRGFGITLPRGRQIGATIRFNF